MLHVSYLFINFNYFFMAQYEIVGCSFVRERVVFDSHEDNMKEITCYVAYVALDDGYCRFVRRFPLPLYPSFMFAQVGKMVESNEDEWNVVLEKGEKVEEVKVL